MTIKTILAYLPSRETMTPVLDVAVRLARRHTAHLVGLHIVPPVPHQRVPRFPIPNEMLIKAEDRLREHANDIEGAFTAATEPLAGNCTWHLRKVADDNLVTYVLRSALSADLVVTSQELDYPFDGVPDSASQLVLAGNRPVVLVPKELKVQTVGKRIVIGWKPGREAGRAVFDALPLLQDAEKVYMVCVDEGASEADSAAQMCIALVRHGVSAERIVLKNTAAGEGLLAQVDALDADLLVMGCFGRSRLSQLIFGGATQHILSHMTVPVLMSH